MNITPAKNQEARNCLLFIKKLSGISNYKFET